ncbi:hypothetical protein ABTZ58_24035 [Streptomyces sp. NPDC094143]|uniref:hypothetical protein n=1 Tax=Streptomyces sp. NPDC094143 TaxID=3155310 RepID=UPI003324BC57
MHTPRSTHDRTEQTGAGCLVGLFWITSAGVFAGGPAHGPTTTEVLLTEDGIGFKGPLERRWPWQEVRAVEVVDPPVRSLRRILGAALDMVSALASPGLDARLMTVTVRTATEAFLVEVEPAVAVAYSERETELSQQLLDRLVWETFSVRTMTAWFGSRTDTGALKTAEREELLSRWLSSD